MNDNVHPARAEAVELCNQLLDWLEQQGKSPEYSIIATALALGRMQAAALATGIVGALDAGRAAHDWAFEYGVLADMTSDKDEEAAPCVL